MRIAIDGLCAEFGGIRTYVEQLVGRWHQLYPEDEVHVFLRAGSTIPTPGLVRHELDVGRPEVIDRPWVQATRMHALIESIRPDAFLATAPTTSVRRTKCPLMVVILDLRAEILPNQFSAGRRLLRQVSYGRSYRLAAGFIAISQRSLSDLHRLHPETTARPGTVAYLGSDHVHKWANPTRSGPAIAFAHHTNKNPDLVIDSWAHLLERGDTPSLTLLGVPAALRPRLQAQIARLGLDAHVGLAPFLSDADFQAQVVNAAAIVFPSAFEGFGLPIVEGMAMRKPVVIGQDPCCLEIAGGHGFVATQPTPGALADAIDRALRVDEAALDSAERWAQEFSWDRTVRVTREALGDLHR